jgi:hypothetical protein
LQLGHTCFESGEFPGVDMIILNVFGDLDKLIEAITVLSVQLAEHLVDVAFVDV